MILFTSATPPAVLGSDVWWSLLCTFSRVPRHLCSISSLPRVCLRASGHSRPCSGPGCPFCTSGQAWEYCAMGVLAPGLQGRRVDRSSSPPALSSLKLTSSFQSTTLQRASRLDKFRVFLFSHVLRRGGGVSQVPWWARDRALVLFAEHRSPLPKARVPLPFARKELQDLMEDPRGSPQVSSKHGRLMETARPQESDPWERAPTAFPRHSPAGVRGESLPWGPGRPTAQLAARHLLVN